jgi:lipoprotein-anchoring transpeptidase ErfK/SrfK
MKLQNEMPGVNAGNLKPTPDPARNRSPKQRNIFLPAVLVLMGCAVLSFAAWSAVRSPVFASMLGSPVSSPIAQQPRVSYARVEIPKPGQLSAQVPDISVAPTVITEPTAVTEPSLTPSPELSVVVTEFPTLVPTLESLVVPTNTEIVSALGTIPQTEPTGVAIAEIVQDTPTSNYVAPTTAPNVPPVVTSPGNGVHWLDVDLSQQRMYAYEGDTLVNSFIVSTGTWQTPTVVGNFKVWVKLRASDMSGPGYYLPDVPFVMYFYKDYGIHGTYWHNNFGTPMSHGCVNLSIADAEWVYNFSSVGTVVNVHY